MDFWLILSIFFRSLSVAIVVILALIYVALQFFQRIPSEKMAFKMFDYISLAVIAFLLALGLNSYWGFIVIVPLALWKVISAIIFTKTKIHNRNKGAWMEVKWHKFPPRGFGNIPQGTMEQLTSELQRLPKDTHFLVPRFAALFAIKYMMKRMRKEKVPASMAQFGEKKNDAIGKFEETIQSITVLEKTKTKVLNLPFGVLHISRL